MSYNEENKNPLIITIRNKISSFRKMVSQKEFSFIRKNKAKLLKEKYKRNKQNEALLQVAASGEVEQESQPVINEFVRTSSTPAPKFPLNLNLFSTNHNSESSLKKYINIKTISATAAVIILAVYTFNVSTLVNAYAVELDGKTIATVAEKTTAEKLLSDLKNQKEKAWDRKVSVDEKLSFKNIQTRKYHLDDDIELKNKLQKSLSFVAMATAIKVDGKVAVVMKDSKEAEAVLAKLKESFNKNDQNVKIDTVSFKEKVEIADVPVSLGEVLSVDKALELIKEGKTAKKTYVVKQGDSLWTIARANDMRVADLHKMNPDLTEDLDLGQEIDLVASEPMINVVLTGQSTVTENMPYKVVVQKDSSVYSGKEKIKTKGENGQKQVTYKVVLTNGAISSKNVVTEKVLKQAKDQVMVKGSKLVVASRSGGKLNWPIHGKITSPFGRRWGEFHTGMDIDGVTGQAVGAAAAGVVVDAGRDGNYGNMILIKHSNGLTTRYAHLSKIEVSVGEKVDQGQLIGRVGSTGRSTGSHLHFEVISGGKTINPRQFLK